MKYLLASCALSLGLFVPSLAFAAPLTGDQVNAIIGVLIAFGVDAKTIDIVRTELVPAPASTVPTIDQGGVSIVPAPVVNQPAAPTPAPAIISSNPAPMPPVALTTTITSAPTTIARQPGDIIATIAVHNSSDAPVTLGSTVATRQKGELDEAYAARMHAAAPALTAARATLAGALGISVTPAAPLQFLYTNGTKPVYKYTQNDLTSEVVVLPPGATMTGQVVLLEAPAGDVTVSAGADAHTIHVGVGE